MDYMSFRKEYELQHPASVPRPPKRISEYPRWLRVLVGLMFVAAALVSGVHTVPTVRSAIESDVAVWVGDFVAACSFVAIELAIFVSAYLRRKNSGLAITIMGITFTVALVANIVSVGKAMGVSGDSGAILVSIILGAGAPLIALTAGEMFVHITDAGRRDEVSADTEYALLLVEFDNAVLEAWEKHQRRQDKRTLSVRTDEGQTRALPEHVRPSAVRSDTDNGQTSHSGFGYQRTADGVAKAIEWFTANPDKAQLPVRTLEPLIGVGRDTISRARRQWLESRNVVETVSTNGHESEGN